MDIEVMDYFGKSFDEFVRIGDGRIVWFLWVYLVYISIWKEKILVVVFGWVFWIFIWNVCLFS